MPAVASAEATYVVNSHAEGITETECEPETECTLTEALNMANGDSEPSTIEFSIEGAIELGSMPQTIVEPVTIDATTLPDYEGSPLVEIDGSETENEGPTEGLVTFGEGQLTLEGIAINGFENNIVIDGDSGPSQICGSYIGTDLSGTEARPSNSEAYADGVGVLITPDASPGNLIGGPGCPGSVISGNGEAGIVDRGEGTEIEGNDVGTDPSGLQAVPNGSDAEFGAGVVLGKTAVGGGAGVDRNTIAHNAGPGVLVEEGATGIRILFNSIFANGGKGIEFPSAPQAAPELGAATTTSGGTKVTGTLHGEPNEPYYVNFFANPECDSSGFGEGKRYIGSSKEGEIETDAAGQAHFEVTGLEPLPTGEDVVTASDETPAGSSEFSNCVTAQRPAPAPVQSAAAIVPPPPPGPTPVNGESVVVAPKAGTVYVKRPGQKKRKLLREGQAIPVGSIVDATHGKVTLTSIDASGKEQTAVFYGGVFLVLQHDGSGLVILRLRGGNFKSCKPSRGKAASSSTRRRKRGSESRRLWGSGKGNFRTEGNYGSASVRGTIWFTEDRCDGTFFKVRRGVVTVRDFSSGRTISLPAGKSYLARP